MDLTYSFISTSTSNPSLLASSFISNFSTFNPFSPASEPPPLLDSYIPFLSSFFRSLPPFLAPPSSPFPTSLPSSLSTHPPFSPQLLLSSSSPFTLSLLASSFHTSPPLFLLPRLISCYHPFLASSFISILASSRLLLSSLPPLLASSPPPNLFPCLAPPPRS